MLQQFKMTSLLAPACLLLCAGCSQNPELRTITEVRVEKQQIDKALTEPCTRANVGSPDPDKATWRDVELFIPVLAKRLNDCADKIDAIRKTTE